MSDFNFMRPRGLRAGSRIALIAPAGPVTADRISVSLERCRSLGLEPVLGPHARERTGYLAGTDAIRAADVMWAFTDPLVDAVWALRGGYGTMRLHSHLDFSLMAAARRPYIGFSDNTYMHLMLLRHGLVSYHAPHPGADFPEETRAAFIQVLFHGLAPGALPLRTQDPAPCMLRAGCADAPLIGGNLSLLAATCGTPAQIRAAGCIVFLEEVGEAAYRVDRALMQLELSGALDGVRGFAFGRFTEIPNGGSEAEIIALLAAVAERHQVPAVVNFPIGHIEHNWTLPLGVRARLDAEQRTLELLEPATGVA